MATEIVVIPQSTAGYLLTVSSTSTGWVDGSTALYVKAKGSTYTVKEDHKDGELALLALITSTATGDATLTLLAGDFSRKNVGNKALTLAKPASGNSYFVVRLEESARFMDEDGYFNFDVDTSDVSVIGIELPEFKVG